MDNLTRFVAGLLNQSHARVREACESSSCFVGFAVACALGAVFLPLGDAGDAVHAGECGSLALFLIALTNAVLRLDSKVERSSYFYYASGVRVILPRPWTGAVKYDVTSLVKATLRRFTWLSGIGMVALLLYNLLVFVRYTSLDCGFLGGQCGSMWMTSFAFLAHLLAGVAFVTFWAGALTILPFILDIRYGRLKAR